jgi:hypothetical protein
MNHRISAPILLQAGKILPEIGITLDQPDEIYARTAEVPEQR